MVRLDIIQGYGNENQCSSERPVVISGLGWRTQCCERGREQEKEPEDNMAAPECEREARKRRERRDSGCAHERKERRPHSEERTPPPPPPPPLHDFNRLESERRAERLSRARRPQYGGKRRRAPSRISKQPKENECFTTTEEIRCTTPSNYDYVVIQKPHLSDEPETLDAAALHRQAGRTRGTICEDSAGDAAERARQHERSAAPLNSTRLDQPCPDRRLEKISKKIHILKKNIAKYETDYETLHGHAIAPSDRITDVQLTRMYESLRQLQAEKRSIKTDPVEYALKVQAAKLQKERDEKLEICLQGDKPMSEIVKDIEEWLEGCRQAGGRSTIPESSWSSAQMAAEKLCVQRVLLRLEAARGRPPAHSAERGAARHLYERYRAVKRVLASPRSDALIGSTNGELATIHEHETMLFNTSVDSSSDSQEKPSDSSQETTETPLQSPPTRDSALTEEMPSSTSSAQSATSDDAAPSNEGLHCLTLEELNRALIEAKLQKSVLRRSIKEYEISFELQNSRKVQRDDKKGREEDYLRYKAIKARIKLLNALINKQKSLTQN
ncbi:protein FAM13A isoform X1 [Bombyx mori]|uniref:FAM13A-like domain-containing protein n=2 Tax=Bombyx mori TaxID=7091 RepID=A0A8R2R4T4_BOMMO|nr:protein FAM13A isoform X1 [Bombyx mori]XP_037874980.1 protein FAM13A isoform X1 [Bombyx mori]XP_037874981.1 protein FAM13A isoform X1 [Bombyx mori]